MYRLEVFSPWKGWHVHALGGSLKELDDWAYRRLEPSGPFRAYRVRRARKVDLGSLAAGYYAPAEDGVLVRVI